MLKNIRPEIITLKIKGPKEASTSNRREIGWMAWNMNDIINR